MTRLAVLPLLLLSIALVACGAYAPKTAQQPQGTPILAPTGENVTIEQKPAKTATPNDAGTLAVMALQATERANEADNVRFAATLSMQSKINNYVLQTQTAQAPAQSATARAQSTQNALMVAQMTKQVDQWTATAAAPVVAATSAKLIADAKNAPVESFAQAWGLIIMDILGFALVVLIGFALANNGHWFERVAVTEAEEDEPEPEPAREQWMPEKTGADLISIPVNIATGKQLRMVADGLKAGLSLTHGNFTPLEKGFSESGWRAFAEYCIDHRPALMIERNPGLKNTAVDPSEKLRDYLRNFETRPAPSKTRPATDTALLPGDRQTDSLTDTQNGVGDGVADHFGILQDGEQ